jgi:hypothetical protein
MSSFDAYKSARTWREYDIKTDVKHGMSIDWIHVAGGPVASVVNTVLNLWEFLE